MKNIFLKYVAPTLVLLTLIGAAACAKPAPTPTPTPAPAPAPTPVAEFEVISLDIEPPEVMAGEAVSITAVVENTGGSEGTYAVILTVDGATVETKEVVIRPGNSKVVTFSLVKDTPGTYEIGIGGQSSSLIVKAKPTLEELAIQIHEDAWSKFASQAESDAYLKYAIYAYRTLAVKHPEVYLQGDNILAEVLTTNAGSKEAYQTKDVHSDYFYQAWTQGASFSFDDVDFTKYNLVSCQELYPSDYPFLPFLDRRLDLITTTLKTFDDRITQLEKAEQLYFAEKKKGYKELYLIYCDNENAYLYRDESLISAREQKEVEQPEGNPILIFNEDDVWYPLMERDDTDKSKLLSELVAKYSTAVKEPKLSDFEKGLIPQLKEVTKFTDARSLVFLKLACINAGQTMPDLLPQEIRQEFIDSRLTFFVWCERALNEKMNLFSPISAYLAAIAQENEGKTGIEAMCDEYAKYTRTSGYRFSHGHIWRCTMLEYGIEHAYRTHAGHCVVQSAAIGATLELAGIDRYRLQGLATSDGRVASHDFIYVPQYHLVISNGIIETSGTVICPSKLGGGYKYLQFVEHNGKWAYLWRTSICSPFYGTLSPNETIEILDYLRSIHNDDIQGGRREGGRLIAIPFEQVKQQLAEEQKRWHPCELPPYGIP